MRTQAAASQACPIGSAPPRGEQGAQRQRDGDQPDLGETMQILPVVGEEEDDPAQHQQAAQGEQQTVGEASPVAGPGQADEPRQADGQPLAGQLAAGGEGFEEAAHG